MAGSVASASSAGTGAANPSRVSIAKNFDTFLTLLTTQLKNQNPLEPLNANEFTQQLVQFSSVEQQIQTNETLKALLATSRTATVTNAASYVGATVTADGSMSQLTNGQARWRLSAPRPVQATLSVRDANGNTVYTERRTLSAGTQDFTWNGRTSTGGFAAEGTYTIRVDAQDANGLNVAVPTELGGVVDGVDLSGSEPVLLIGTARVPIGSVKSLRR